MGPLSRPGRRSGKIEPSSGLKAGLSFSFLAIDRRVLGRIRMCSDIGSGANRSSRVKSEEGLKLGIEIGYW